MQITNARVAIDEINAIKERLENGFKRIYGDDIALTPDTPDGQMIGLFSEALDEVNQCLIFAVQMLDPYLAQGEWLDQRVAYAGLLRKQAEFSRANGVTIHGNTNVKIPKGTILIDKNNNPWSSDYEVVLGSEGSAVVSITSAQAGAFSINSGDEFKLQEIILGVDRIVAAQSGILGSLEETDGELLKRFMLSHSINNNDDRQGLEAYLLNLDGVTQCKVLENYTNVTDENGLPPHSLNAIVLGGDDDEIAQAILRKKIGGCGLSGQTTIETDYLGMKREAKFDRPKTINPKISMQLKRIENYTQINTDKIKQILTDKIFNIGEDLYASRLYSLINEAPGFEILSLSIDGTQSKAIGVREIAVLLSKDIEILVV
ncbi:baseplate J/gp47 family protein [Campylobacter sp.]|uniref:baseplate J/gp47 family protein n=1 Tax=Campylobacter sp. TaxID=205 RepID=UPI00290ED064|nr:baseplate J/gp47 family protein [Campylobacter sp.]MDU6827745.1 baseplate J/gp47 family protein [Campylobacter sp.]